MVIWSKYFAKQATFPTALVQYAPRQLGCELAGDQALMRKPSNESLVRLPDRVLRTEHHCAALKAQNCWHNSSTHKLPVTTLLKQCYKALVMWNAHMFLLIFDNLANSPVLLLFSLLCAQHEHCACIPGTGRHYYTQVATARCYYRAAWFLCQYHIATSKSQTLPQHVLPYRLHSLNLHKSLQLAASKLQDVDDDMLMLQQQMQKLAMRRVTRAAGLSYLSHCKLLHLLL